MQMPISKLSDDCLELIFIACEGCPWTLYSLSKVCRQWYIIIQRPSVVSFLLLATYIPLSKSILLIVACVNDR